MTFRNGFKNVVSSGDSQLWLGKLEFLQGKTL